MQPTDPNKFTDKAWDAIVKSQDIARSFLQQQLDVEHLILALLEPNELGDRILTKAGIELSRFQQQLDAFTQRQPKIVDLSVVTTAGGLSLDSQKATG